MINIYLILSVIIGVGLVILAFVVQRRTIRKQDEQIRQQQATQAALKAEVKNSNVKKNVEKINRTLPNGDIDKRLSDGNYFRD